MASPRNPGEQKPRISKSVFVTIGLCGFFYVLAAWQKGGFGKGDRIALEITKQTDCSILSKLKYVNHQEFEEDFQEAVKQFQPCNEMYIDYTPCHNERRDSRERHCPPQEQKLHCLVPAPKGYTSPYKWPMSRDYVPYANVPYKYLTVEKSVQNWIQFQGNALRFSGGGTQFPHGVDAYINQVASVIPFDNGTVRSVLDIGCRVGDFGAYLFKKNAITMSFAPRDSHELNVQLALERGVPAVIGVLGTIKLPYPVGAFDVVHCSHCLIQWDSNGGMYMMEVDRVLRPGGYWVLSGPPINWRNHFRTWKRPKEQLEKEQKRIEEIANLLCWEKIKEMDQIAIWRKRLNFDQCREQNAKVRICKAQNPNDVWYQKMQACVTPYPLNPERKWETFPDRLNSVPFRILNGSIPEMSPETYKQDLRLWKKHVNLYRRVNKILDSGRYRNIMDMNAGLGSFASVLESPKSWVMNVVPTISRKETLSVIYERGLIGVYHDWCEAFSTYPRTYDLIHANGVFSLYKDKCKSEDILLEMDRILRPEGTVILRDQVEVLREIRRTVRGMRWKTQMVDHEDDPLASEKILFAVKQYWVAEGNSNNPNLINYSSD